MIRTALILLATMVTIPAYAVDVYLDPDQFLEQAFNGNVPHREALPYEGELKKTINRIMGHNYAIYDGTFYWSDGNRTVWILEEIGKVKPITTGIIVNDGKIEQLKVLIYRESHGWEVRYDFFTEQFDNATLTENNRLSNRVDNISGATMSVGSLRNLGRLALFLHQQVVK